MIYIVQCNDVLFQVIYRLCIGLSLTSLHNSENNLAELCPFFAAVNEYVFMVQARGIQIRENMKNIGAQVLEQVVRGAYILNGTGKCKEK